MKKTISVAFLASMFAVSALAGLHTAVKESGFYAVGGFGYGSMRAAPDYSLVPGLLGPDIDSRAGIAYALSVGYQINKILGVEAGYMVFPSVRTVDADTGSFRISTTAITLLGRYTHAISSEFDLTAGAGVSITSSYSLFCLNGGCHESSRFSNDFYQVVPTFALGTNYHVNNQVSLGIEGRITTRAAVYPETYTGLVNVIYKFS